MKEVLAIIRPERWTATKAALGRLGLPAFTHRRVLGRGRARGLKYIPRHGAAPQTAVAWLPKRMIFWVVEDHAVTSIVQALVEANQTGRLGDGRIFVLPLEEAVRVRTGQRGVMAIRPQAVAGTVRQEEPHADAR